MISLNFGSTETGQVVFRYNLTWEALGSKYNGLLRETGTGLDAIETVIADGKGLHWLPIEVIADEVVEVFLTELDTACAIPRPKSIKRVVAA